MFFGNSFYADAQLQSDLRSFPIPYRNFWRFVSDFDLLTLKLSQQEIAGIYLAACACPGLPSSISRDGSSKLLSNYDPDSKGDESQFSSFTEMENTETPHLAQSWTQMHYKNFLMFLAILGIHCFRMDQQNNSSQNHVKAIMYHLSRCMTPRQIETVLIRRKHISTYPLLLTTGIAHIQKVVLKVWRLDGHQDYVTQAVPGNMIDEHTRLVNVIYTKNPAVKSDTKTPRFFDKKTCKLSFQFFP